MATGSAEMRAAGGAAELLLVKESFERQIRPDQEPTEALGRKIRVLLVDDHRIVRESLTRLLQMQGDMEVVGQASDGLQAIQMALQLQPDVVVMDVTMPGLNGIEATRRIHSQLPHVRVVGLSMHDESEVAASMTAAGAVAYVTKTAPPATLISAIRENASPPTGRSLIG